MLFESNEPNSLNLRKKSNAWGTKEFPHQISKRQGDQVLGWRHLRMMLSESSVFSPPLQRGLYFLPSKYILPPTQRSRPSGKFQQECKLRDVYKTEIDFIKWPPVWSPGKHSTQTFPLWAKECCLHLPLEWAAGIRNPAFRLRASRSTP